VRPNPIEIQVKAPGEELLIEVIGELDMATTPMFSNVLGAVRGNHPRVVVDLSRVDFMGSSGVAAILRAREDLADSGQDLVLRLPSRPVQRVLELTGVGELLARPSPRLQPDS
jgi:anti-sigma B factor antagonist